jgi:hypothetical protein
LQENPRYQLKTFSGGGKIRQLIVKNDKIVIPASLLRGIVDWYHTYLCHPGETCTELNSPYNNTSQVQTYEKQYTMCAKDVQLVKEQKGQQNTENFPKRRLRTSRGKTLSVRIKLRTRKVAPF